MRGTNEIAGRDLNEHGPRIADGRRIFCRPEVVRDRKLRPSQFRMQPRSLPAWLENEVLLSPERALDQLARRLSMSKVSPDIQRSISMRARTRDAPDLDSILRVNLAVTNCSLRDGKDAIITNPKLQVCVFKNAAGFASLWRREPVSIGKVLNSRAACWLKAVCRGNSQRHRHDAPRTSAQRALLAPVVPPMGRTRTIQVRDVASLARCLSR
jgi:hypothetical protein